MKIANRCNITEQGAALYTAVIMLLVFSIMLISSSTTAFLQQKMAVNTHEKIKTLHSADSATNIVMNDLAISDLAKIAGNAPNVVPQTQTYSTLLPTTGGIAPQASMQYRARGTAPGFSVDQGIFAHHFQTTTTASIVNSASTTIGAGFYRVGLD